jgi:hypothetical protein
VRHQQRTSLGIKELARQAGEGIGITLITSSGVAGREHDPVDLKLKLRHLGGSKQAIVFLELAGGRPILWWSKDQPWLGLGFQDRLGAKCSSLYASLPDRDRALRLLSVDRSRRATRSRPAGRARRAHRRPHTGQARRSFCPFTSATAADCARVRVLRRRTSRRVSRRQTASALRDPRYDRVACQSRCACPRGGPMRSAGESVIAAALP